MKISVTIAFGVEPSQSTGISVMRAHMSRWFRIPYRSFSSQRQTSTATTVERKYGNRTRLRASERNIMLWCSMSATRMPNTICSHSVPAVQITLFFSDSQNSPDLSSRE